MRFSVKQLLIATALVALVFVAIRGTRRIVQCLYYWQLNDTYDVLLDHPEMTDVQIWGNVDVTYEVEHISFALDGMPGKRFEFYIEDGCGRQKRRETIEKALAEAKASAQ
jgi:hypothetical protein